jgi:predicted acyltransferase
MQILLPALGRQQSTHKHAFAEWMTSQFGLHVPALVFVVLWWLIVYAMDRHRIYLKL